MSYANFGRHESLKCPNILDEWNGYPESLSFSQALEISRQYLLLRTVILQKKVAGCPCKIVEYANGGTGGTSPASPGGLGGGGFPGGGIEHSGC